MIKTAETSTRVETSSPSRRSPLIWLIKVVVSGGLLYVLLGRVDLSRLWQTARTASVPWLAGALLMYAVMIFIASWRWWLLVRAQHLGLAFG